MPCSKHLWNAGFCLLSPIIILYRSIVNTCTCTKKYVKIEESIETQLSRNYDDLGGYNAGTCQYDNVWTRDSFFAFFNPHVQTRFKKKFVDRLRENMKTNGHVPFTFWSTYYIPAILCGCIVKRRKPTASFFDEKLGTTVLDANSQYIILVHDVYNSISDNYEKQRWIIKHESNLNQAMEFLDAHVNRKGLIEEGPFANWEDSLMFRGAVPYTNLLWLEATKRLLELNQNKTLFLKNIDFKYRKNNVFRLLGAISNPDTVTASLCVLWYPEELVSNVLFALLYNKFRKRKRFGIPNRLQRLPKNMVFYPLRVIGQGKYHNGWLWSWVGLLWAVALYKKGKIGEAKTVFNMFKKKVDKYGTVFEVYDKHGLPINRVLYKSEDSFSEGLGMYLYAKDVICNSSEELQN